MPWANFSFDPIYTKIDVFMLKVEVDCCFSPCFLGVFAGDFQARNVFASTFLGQKPKIEKRVSICGGRVPQEIRDLEMLMALGYQLM